MVKVLLTKRKDVFLVHFAFLFAFFNPVGGYTHQSANSHTTSCLETTLCRHNKVQQSRGVLVAEPSGPESRDEVAVGLGRWRGGFTAVQFNLSGGRLDHLWLG
jgi:hypothetical protein